MADKKPGPPLIRALGLLAGDLWCGITGKPRKSPDKTVVRKDVQEKELDTPRGKVTLRRTTIDEIEVPHPDKE